MKDPIWEAKLIPEKNDIETFQKQLQVNGEPFNRIITTLLLQRQINTFEDAQLFFKGNLENLHDPFLMADMPAAVNKLTEQLASNKKILIYGDYDVDGTTAVALMYLFLKNTFPEIEIEYYVPDRYTEGYGISFQGINYAKENDCSLIIALDCGIKAVEEVALANENNIDVIICDHHTPGEKLPEAVAVLDPKRNDCQYPFKELSGCGVGFKLLQAFSLQNDIPIENLLQYIDLVALSIASDIVPISGENRILCRAGVEKIENDPLPGIAAILENSGILGKKLEVSDLVFKIGPRINAAGRMIHAKQSVKLLIGEDTENLTHEANAIGELNAQRKEVDLSIKDEVFEMIRQTPDHENLRSVVLYKPDWHKGVLGIVASRVVEAFYKPTILLKENEGFLVGSARSIDGFNLYEAIDACSDLLENYGGHKYAAGLTMKAENFDDFKTKFESYVSANITEEQLHRKIYYDLIISLDEIDYKLFRLLNLLRPFGPENMTPVFISENLKDSGYSKAVGANNEHLQLFLTDGNCSVKGIAFNQAEKLDLIKSGSVNICYEITENIYRGNASLQLVVRDIKPSE